MKPLHELYLPSVPASIALQVRRPWQKNRQLIVLDTFPLPRPEWNNKTKGTQVPSGVCGALQHLSYRWMPETLTTPSSVFSSVPCDFKVTALGSAHINPSVKNPAIWMLVFGNSVDKHGTIFHVSKAPRFRNLRLFDCLPAASISRGPLPAELACLSAASISCERVASEFWSFSPFRGGGNDGEKDDPSLLDEEDAAG